MRSLISRPTSPAPAQLSKAPGLAVQPIDFWQPPKGLDYLSPHTRVQKQYSSQMLNMWLDRGRARSRYGTTAVGSSIANLMAVMNFISSNGVGTLVRFTTTKVQRWTGTTWVDVYTGFTGTLTDHFTFTAFGGKLLFSNGVDGIFEFDFDNNVVTKIAGAPPCRQLSTFGGRVLASNVLSIGNERLSRVVWCVKDNSHIWPDSPDYTDNEKLGSGYEDLLSAPGGQIDIQRGVWPVTDTIALCVRSKSVWQVNLTGVVDSPFSFNRLYDNIGSDAPNSIDVFPGGIVGLFNDDFYMMSHASKQPIGALVRDVVLDETTEPGDAVGFFEPFTKNYWFSNQSSVYRFSIPDQGWSRHQYPFSVIHMMRTKSTVSGLTIDQLTGTIDGLDAQYPTIDQMVGNVQVVGNYFVSRVSGSGYVIQEQQALTQDADGAGGTVDSPISDTTGAVLFGTSLQRGQVLNVQLECDVGTPQALLLELSRDGGGTWETYSLKSLSTGDLQIVPFVKTVNSRLITLRLSSTKLGQLAIIGLWAFGQPGALVNQ